MGVVYAVFQAVVPHVKPRRRVVGVLFVYFKVLRKEFYVVKLHDGRGGGRSILHRHIPRQGRPFLSAHVVNHVFSHVCAVVCLWLQGFRQLDVVKASRTENGLSDKPEPHLPDVAEHGKGYCAILRAVFSRIEFESFYYPFCRARFHKLDFVNFTRVGSRKICRCRKHIVFSRFGFRQLRKGIYAVSRRLKLVHHLAVVNFACRLEHTRKHGRARVGLHKVLELALRPELYVSV